MLEAVLAWLINNWVGEYFDNVNTDQLSIAYGEGQIELEGLPLKVEPFRRLGLPFDIRSGYAGKLRLALRLRSGACSVSIDELFLVCAPRSEFTFDERREQEREQDLKLRLLEALENKWKLSFDSHQDMSYYPSYSTFLSLSTSLFANFTENLQFNIRDVHLRYEDDVTQSDANIVAGLLIRNLSIQSADDNWEPTFVVAGTTQITRKLVELEGFSIYFDSNVPLVKELDREDAVDEMRKGMQLDSDHVHILEPVNGKAFVSRNLCPQPLRSRSTPRITIDFRLEQIALSLNIVQYQLFISMFDEVTRRQLLLKNCRFRPKVPIRGNAKEWWHYAINVFLNPWREERRKSNWEFVLQRSRQITSYCDVYLACVAQPEDVSREMKLIRDQIEQELSFEELKPLREVVYNKYQKLCLPAHKTGQEAAQGWSYLRSWLPSWSWFGDTNTSNSVPADADEGIENMSFTSNFEDDIMDVLNTAADEYQSTQDVVFTQMNFSLEEASAVLIADPLYLKSTPVRKPHAKKMQQIMQFVMKKPLVTIETRPRTCTHKFHAKFTELTLEDKVSSAPNFAYLIAPQAASHLNGRETYSQSEPVSDLFELILEKKWGSDDIVNKLYVKTEPLQIVYSKSVFDVLYRFFSSKSFLSQQRSSFLSKMTRLRYENFKSQTKAEIQSAVEDLFHEKGNVSSVRTVKWEFDLQISAPQIIIPHDISSHDSSLVIFDLGRLVFRNRSLNHLRSESDDNEVFVTPPSTPQVERMEFEPSDVMDVKSIYQSFCLEVNDVQLVVGSASDKWNHALQRGSGPLHVLNRFSLTFELQRRLTSYSPDLPRVILTGSLPQMFVFLDENKILSLKTFSELFLKAKPQQDEQETASGSRQESAIQKPNKIFFLTELNIHRFSVALQCRKQNLAEVQVFEVQCKLEKSRKCYCVSFSVSSLMMIDAHQKLGKEFEILLASHNDFVIDPRDGVLSDVHHRIRSFSTIVADSQLSPGSSDALISLKFTSNADRETLDLVFNHFDVIANQETLIELVAFFKGIFPSDSSSSASTTNGEPGAKRQRTGFSRQTEIRVDFRHLNVLLLRSIECLKTGQEKKVATASFSGAKICIRLDQEVMIEGSLQKMKIMDLCSKECRGDQAIMKIGSDVETLGPGQSQSKAVEFTLKRTFTGNLIDLNVSLISLYYLHSPRFLQQLTSCAKEFKAYMSALATTLTSAATEVAKELVLTPNLKPNSGKERKLRKISSSLVKELRVQLKVENPLVVLPFSPSFIEGIKRSIWQDHPIDSQEGLRSVILEGFAIGLDVQNGSIRLVDDVDEDRSLTEILLKEVYLFHQSKDLNHKGNVRTVVSCDYFHRLKKGWEPLIELWSFTLAWDVKKERLGRDGIIHRSIGSSKKGKLTVISCETLNFNLTNMSLDLYRLMKNKWDAVEIDQPEDADRMLAITSSPINLLINPRQKPGGVIPSSEWNFMLELPCIGISLVNHLNEELVYITMSHVLLEYLKTDSRHSVNCTVREMQVDNQLRGPCREVAIHPLQTEPNDPMHGQPALTLSLQKNIVPHVHHFADFQLKCKDVAINLEELLLLKLYEFFGYPGPSSLEQAVGRAITNTASAVVSKASSFVYVVLMEIFLRRVDLSVYTSGHLPSELLRLKERLGLSLISFENAKVTLQAFTKENALEDMNSLWHSIVDHYRRQLQKQAAKILGSVDFLGNPIGFMNDVSEGLTELAEGNVSGLVANLAHGITNSTAKLTSSLSKSLEVTTVDQRHQEMRRRIHQDGRDHFRAGIRGLGVGIMGGVTSIVTQTYDGVANRGFEGLISGFGKGLLGTVTKPAVGVLDFASGAASAARETMRKINHQTGCVRKRPPRVCVGPRGLLPPFDEDQALGQQYFYTSSNIRDREDSETFDSFHTVSSECACFISNEKVRFVSWNPASKRHGKMFLSLSFDDIVKCTTEKKRISSDMTIAQIVILAEEEEFPTEDFTSTDFPSFGPSDSLQGRKRNKIRTTNALRCSNDKVAMRLCQVINLAKCDFDKKRAASTNWV